MANRAAGPPPGTTFLTGSQAAQILEKLKVIKNNEGQTIKIQTIQTNPQTGAKQIVAIPIVQTSSSSSSSSLVGAGPANLIVSPMKAMRTYGSEMAGAASGLGRTIKIGSPRAVALGGYTNSGLLSLVKPSSIQLVSMTSGAPTVHVTPTVVSAAGTAHSFQSVHSYPASGSSSLSLTPQKRTAAAPLFQNVKFEAVKRQQDFDPIESSDAKRRKTDKGGKGLRHFSMKVCEKVKAKGSTSYNEVADELVTELTDPRCQSPSDQQYDQKNIRRRVYDALNVLMAMNIISKEKKEIRWLGLPTNSVQEAYTLESDKAERIERIKTKTQQLQDLILQQIAFKNLVERNKETEKTTGAPTPNSAIQLPFIVVNTSKKTVIDCSISNDKMEYLFNFDNTFEIHDDMEVLKRMNMVMGLDSGRISEENVRRARSMVPRALQNYVDEMARRGSEAYTSLMPKVSTPNLLLKEELGTDFDVDEDEFGGEEMSDDND